MENFKYYISVCVALKVYSVHKYVIFKNKYPKSVQICHLFFISVCKTGHLTPIWTENVFKYKIEIILCTWHGKFQILHKVYGSLLKSTLCINMAHILINIRKCANMSLSLQMCWNMYTYDV